MVWPGGSGILSLIAAPNQCHDSVMPVVLHWSRPGMCSDAAAAYLKTAGMDSGLGHRYVT